MIPKIEAWATSRRVFWITVAGKSTHERSEKQASLDGETEQSAPMDMPIINVPTHSEHPRAAASPVRDRLQSRSWTSPPFRRTPSTHMRLNEAAAERGSKHIESVKARAREHNEAIGRSLRRRLNADSQSRAELRTKIEAERLSADSRRSAAAAERRQKRLALEGKLAAARLSAQASSPAKALESETTTPETPPKAPPLGAPLESAALLLSQMTEHREAKNFEKLAIWYDGAHF